LKQLSGKHSGDKLLFTCCVICAVAGMDVQAWHLVSECWQGESDRGRDNDQLLPDQQTLTHDSNCSAPTAVGITERQQLCMREFAVIPSIFLSFLSLPVYLGM
jgi:hypothetical protein